MTQHKAMYTEEVHHEPTREELVKRARKEHFARLLREALRGPLKERLAEARALAAYCRKAEPQVLNITMI